MYQYGFDAGDTNDGFNICNDGNVLVNVIPGIPIFDKVQTEIHVSSK